MYSLLLKTSLSAIKVGYFDSMATALEYYRMKVDKVLLQGCSLLKDDKLVYVIF